jgi:hypothetical protein
VRLQMKQSKTGFDMFDGMLSQARYRRLFLARALDYRRLSILRLIRLGLLYLLLYPALFIFIGCGFRSAENGGPEDSAIRVVQRSGGACYRPPDYVDFSRPPWLNEVSGNPVVEANWSGARTYATDEMLAQLAPLKNLRRLIVGPGPVSDSGVKHLLSFVHLRELSLAGTRITDAAVKDIVQLQKLEVIHLGGTRISDQCLADLSKIDSIRELALGRTSITDDGIKSLARLQNLEVLRLSGTQLTDAGVGHLDGLANLRILTLDGTNVSDACLRTLSRMRKLRTLCLVDTKVTLQGARELMGSLRQCNVQVNVSAADKQQR